MIHLIKISLVAIAIIASTFIGCSFGSPKQISADSFRSLFEIEHTMHSPRLIGVTDSNRVYCENRTLAGIRPLLGFGPQIEIVYAQLSDFPEEERANLSEGKIPWGSQCKLGHECKSRVLKKR